MTNAISEDMFNRIKKLQSLGMGSHKIAAALGINQSTALKYMHREEYTQSGPSSPTTPDLPVFEESHPYTERDTMFDPFEDDPLMYGEDESEPQEEVLDPIEEHKLKTQNRELRKKLKEALDAHVTNSRLIDFAQELEDAKISVPKWSKASRDRDPDSAVAIAMLSDLHLDEIVEPSQVGGVNAFSRSIADIRMQNFFDNTARVATEFVNGIKYDGLYLILGGDIFSGNIHEELQETNEGTIMESLVYWVGPIASGIKYLADVFGTVHIPCVVGNHGRNTRKPRMKNRAQDNFDWLFYHMLAMTLKEDTRITWDISSGADCHFNIYDTSIMLTHGDQFRGGSGISGPATPWLLGDHKKRKRQTAIHMPYDYLMMGHWHQLTLGLQGIIVNGSVKGYDEFAYISNFPYEDPMQAFMLIQPGVGMTGRWPIHVLGQDEKRYR